MPAIFSQQRVMAATITPPPPPPPPPPAAPSLTVTAGASSGIAGGASISGPTISAPNDNLSAVAWAISATPSGLTASPSSGTLSAGQSVTPTLSSISAAIYAITVANNSGGSISGSAGNVQFYAPTPPPPPPPPAPPPPAPSEGSRQFTLTTSSTGEVPFTAGFAFRQGDIASGQGVVVSGADAQVSIKNTWPDGSARTAIVSGTYSSSGTATTVTLAAGTSSTGTALTVSNLVSAMSANDVVFDTTSFGSATFSSSDWSSPFLTWVTGHKMSSWIYRKPIGSDAHLVAWIEVRLYSGGIVEILPWIENGYLNVAGPTNKNTTYSLTIGGVSRFSQLIDLKHHTRTPLINGTMTSYWIGRTDPDVIIRHDAAYLESTEMVPTYRAKVSAGASLINSVSPTSYAPLQQGGFIYSSDSMSSGGAAQPIGLLPAHDVLYLTCDVADAARVYKGVIFNGYSAGRYRHHYRDETTNRPPRFSAYPTLVLAGGASTTSTYTPTPSGGEAPERDIAHHPSVGYMAYLVTGRWYFMEEIMLSANFNHFGKTDSAIMRDGAKGLFQSVFGGYQTRASAWAMRTFVQALAVIPDEDTVLKTEHLNVWHENIDKYHAQYVAQPGNPWGWVEPGESYGLGLQHGAPWQQDFHSAAVGYARALNLTSDTGRAAKWVAFHEWKAQCTIKRFGLSNNFWYINGAPYVQLISASALTEDNFRNGTGTFYTEAESYAQLAAGLSAASSPTSWIGTTEGILGGEIMPGEMSMWGNAMPSLAYAVRFGITGAKEALYRLKTSRNWQLLENAFNSNPVWGVQAASGEFVTPSYLTSVPIHQWVEIAGTSGVAGAQVDPWGAFTVTPDGRLIVSASGGHGDSADNRVVQIDLKSNSPSWEILEPTSAIFQENVRHYSPDNHPVSRHNYHNTFYVNSLNRVFHVGAAAYYSLGGYWANTDAYNLTNLTWDAPNTYAPVPEGDGSGKQGVVFDGAFVWSNTLRRYSPFTNQWFDGARFGRITNIVEMPWAFDSKRQQLFGLSFGTGTMSNNSGTVIHCGRVPVTGSTEIQCSLNASSGKTSFESERPGYAGMDYDPINDRFLWIAGLTTNIGNNVSGFLPGKVYEIKPTASPNDFDISVLNLTGPTPTNTIGAGVNGRFKYVPILKAFVYLPQRTSNLWIFRVG